MAVLLVTLSVMAVMMTVLMPAWKHLGQREKEAELVFRGEQYGRALMLFSRKHGPGTTPPSVDLLVQERVLRKKFKDPITKDDFQVILMGQGTSGSTSPGSTPRGGASTPTQGISGGPQRGGSQGAGSPLSQGAGGAGQGATGGVGGIWGFASKSKDESIRIYKGRTHYNEWVFNAPQQAQSPGSGAPGGIPGVGGSPGGRGGPTGIPGSGGTGRPGGPGPGPGGGRFQLPTPSPTRPPGR